MSRKTGLPEYVHRRRTRHGKVVLHFSRTGKAPYVRLPDDPKSPEFWAAYTAARKGEPPPSKPALDLPNGNTFRWLVAQYIKARYADEPEHTSGIDKDKAVLEACCLEPISAKDKRRYADIPLSALTGHHLEILRQRKSSKGKPSAANNRVDALKRMTRWAARREILAKDIGLTLDPVKITSKGWPMWEPADITKYEQHWPTGSKQRLALDLLLYTGAARVDVVGLGPANLNGSVIRYKRQKSNVEANVPVPPQMLASIAQTMPTGLRTWLVSGWGRAFTPMGFGLRFANWCKLAGIEKKRAHGLRKAAATRMAERGATSHQLCAMFGWLTLAEAQRYTQAADRRRMGESAANLL
jgi:integrase